MEKLAPLESLPLFLESPPEVRAAMEATAHAVVLRPGEFFYREAGGCAHFALVAAGDLRVFKSGALGREVTLYHVRDGESCLVNLLCVMLGVPAMASACAEEETAAILFPGAMLDRWMADSAAVRRFVLQAVAARMVGVMSLVEEIAFQHVDRRLALLLLRHFAREPVVAATHEQLAAELGTAREVVSRVLGEFARRGAIHAARGRIELVDAATLRQLT